MTTLIKQNLRLNFRKRKYFYFKTICNLTTTNDKIGNGNRSTLCKTVQFTLGSGQVIKGWDQGLFRVRFYLLKVGRTLHFILYRKTQSRYLMIPPVIYCLLPTIVLKPDRLKSKLSIRKTIPCINHYRIDSSKT